MRSEWGESLYGEDVRNRKVALRESAKRARQSIPSTARESAARKLGAELLTMPELASAQLVLAYAATREELDPSIAINGLRFRSIRIAYPRMTSDRTLDLHECEPSQMMYGPHGIRQPPETSPVVNPSQVSAVLVPGLAFDAAGHRLGFGGGYYDRLLAELSGALRIGIAFEEQMLDNVPFEPHDIPMHLIALPGRTIYCR